MNRDISKQKMLQLRQKRKLREWLQQSELLYDSKELIDLWERSRDSMIEPLLKLAVKSLASVEGVQKVNEIFKNSLKLDSAEIDINEFTQQAVKIFRIEILKIILSNTDLALQTRRNILKRFVSKEYPIRDNVSTDDGQVVRALREVNRIQPSSIAGKERRISTLPGKSIKPSIESNEE